MLTLVIRIKEGKTLKDVATEVQALNAYAAPETPFPRPIQCNPDSVTVYGFLGCNNTSPDEQGFVNVQIDNYSYLCLAFLPAQPSTFDFVFGVPETTVQFA